MIPKKWILSALILLLINGLLTSDLFAETRIDKEYIIGAGDMLNIQVYDEPELNRTVEVSREGAFTFPLIGKVEAAGRSVFGLEKELLSRLADGYLVTPHVTVSISKYRHQKVFLFGEVKKPGTYITKGETSLLELISEVGGFAADAGSVATIVRPGLSRRREGPVTITEARQSEIISIDLDRLTSGTFGGSVYVMPGDSVYIHEAPPIFVTGEVKKPGQYKWEKDLSVRQAISIAGGPSKVGAPNRTRIVRLENGKERSIKPRLSDAVRPNDIIKVPKSYF